MNKNIYLKNWRNRTKQRLIEAFGGSCGICKYNKCIAALEFHHLESKDKEFNISRWAKVANWTKICEEAKKCVCLCSNCHREVHFGIKEIPKDIKRFDENFITYREIKCNLKNKCKCGNEKLVIRKNCSLKCSGISRSKIDWENIDLEILLSQFSYTEIGKQLGISDVAVRKRAIKLGLAS